MRALIPLDSLPPMFRQTNANELEHEGVSLPSYQPSRYHDSNDLPERP